MMHSTGDVHVQYTRLALCPGSKWGRSLYFSSLHLIRAWVYMGWAIHIPSIDDIILDGVETGEPLALHHFSRTEQPRTMADWSNHLAFIKGRFNKIQKSLIPSPIVWSPASRDDQSIKILIHEISVHSQRTSHKVTLAVLARLMHVY